MRGGTKSGGRKARDTNRRKYGNDYYAKIGSLGGKLGTTGGFGQGEAGKERARIAGAKGGAISKRRRNSTKIQVKEPAYSGPMVDNSVPVTVWQKKKAPLLRRIFGAD